MSQGYVIEITTLDDSGRPLAVGNTRTPLRRDLAEQVLRILELDPPKPNISLRIVQYQQDAANG